MAKQRKQPAAQQPPAAGPVATPAVPAPVAAPAVVMLLAPAAPVVAQAPEAPEPEPQPEVRQPSPMTDAECAAFMGVVETPAAPAQAEPTPEPPRLTAEQRENPRYLTGEALRALAHRRGIARSEAARMSDEKLREQLRYITAHQYETEAA